VRIDQHGPHGRQVLQGFVNAHGIEDPEGFFGYVFAKPSGVAQHLVEQDAVVGPAQEHQIADRRHVHAGGQQIHRHGDIGV